MKRLGRLLNIDEGPGVSVRVGADAQVALKVKVPKYREDERGFYKP
jgi:hypothetical protein